MLLEHLTHDGYSIQAHERGLRKNREEEDVMVLKPELKAVSADRQGSEPETEAILGPKSWRPPPRD